MHHHAIPYMIFNYFFLAAMNERRDHCSAVFFKEKIYVFGGSYGQIIHNSVECYSPKANKWKVVTHLPSTRHGFKCIPSVVNRSLVEKISFEQVWTRRCKLILLTLTLPMTYFIILLWSHQTILLWPTPDDFTRQCWHFTEQVKVLCTISFITLTL